MKRFVCIVLGFLIGCTSLLAARQAEGIVKGSVEDASGAPLGFATVYLTGADGAIVSGTAADADGLYLLKAAVGEYILKVSLIGFKDASCEIHLTEQGVDLPAIRLEEDAQLLEGAVVQAVMPKTKLTGEGLQTSVRGSVLENVGSANDVLAKTPGLIKGQNGLEVIGKGAPLIYINGRKVNDATELERLQSNEIQSVEVITNPGAQYDATVRSVVRIKTVRRQGDGFGFNFNASDAQSLRWARGNDPFAALNANYRTGGVDLFAGINYAGNTSLQLSDLEKTTYGRNYTLENKGDLKSEYFGKSVYGNTGVNWQIADNHFVGGKVEWGRQLQYMVHAEVNDNVILNGKLTDKLTTISDDTMGEEPYYNLGGNLYYNGLIGGKLGIDVNLDYYGVDNPTESVSKETSSMTHNASIESSSWNDSRLYAAKAVLSCPIWQGQMQAGTEETFTRRSDEYHISGIDIPASDAMVKENTYAAFASYGFMLPKAGMFNAGVRYEYVQYSYADAVSPHNDLTRNYGNWFPNLSYAGAFGPVQLMLNYSAKTRRPNFAYLSGAIRYNSRYIWQSGNAQLQPELSHNLSATAVWKFFTFMVNYTRTNDAIMTWSSPYGDEGVVLVQPRNIDTPFRSMSAFVNLTPTVGIWNMNYTFGVQPQWLTINAPDSREASGIRVTKFNGKPIWFAQLFNTFTVKGGWQFEAGLTGMTRGYTQNMYISNCYLDLNAAVQKTLLKDGSLVLRLEGHDLARMAHYNGNSDFGSHTISQTNLMDTQKVKLSIRYIFNAAQSKYRGTGAGSDEKARM